MPQVLTPYMLWPTAHNMGFCEAMKFIFIYYLSIFFNKIYWFYTYWKEIIFLNKKNQPDLFSDWFLYLSVLLVRTDTSLVQMAGIEPARFIQPQDFKSCASASSATSAFIWTDKNYYNTISNNLSILFLFFLDLLHFASISNEFSSLLNFKIYFYCSYLQDFKSCKYQKL